MYYIAPEQVKGETALDARTDIYSLGMVLYEALTGQKAFDSSSQFEVMQAHVRAMPLPPSAIRPGLPAALDQIVLTAVAKERDARFGNARRFREALERVQSAPARAPQAMAAAAAVSAAARQPAETPLPDQIVETWVSEKSSPAAAPAAQGTALGTAPQTRAPGRVTIQELLYDDGRLDPRVVGLITFVVTLVICFGLLFIVR